MSDFPAVVRLGDVSQANMVEVTSQSDVTVVGLPSAQASPAVIAPVGSAGLDVIDMVSNAAPPIVSSSYTGYQSRPGEVWWKGEGPPPAVIVGSREGDFYWDTITGDVWELQPDP